MGASSTRDIYYGITYWTSYADGHRCHKPETEWFSSEEARAERIKEISTDDNADWFTNQFSGGGFWEDE